MNKEYQEALDNIKNMGDKDLYNERHLKWAETIQQLVDKETPKKTIKERFIQHGRLHQRHYCSICKQPLLVLSNYCAYCGNGTDWGGE